MNTAEQTRKRKASIGDIPTPPMSDSATIDIPWPPKRKRTSSLPTPPASDYDIKSCSLLQRATEVLAKQTVALSHITCIYQNDHPARQSLVDAVNVIVKSQQADGKLVVCGVGKSAYIGMKLVATCKSLGVAASFLHACEAAHGDLGDIRRNDVLLFVSFSGKTPELLNLLPHISQSIPVMALTSHARMKDCRLLADRDRAILLPAPIPEPEEEIFGVAAPTTSTTVALAVADMLALTVADAIHVHGEDKRGVFKRNHPGGAIGMNHREVDKLKRDGVDVSILELPSPTISASEGDDR